MGFEFGKSEMNALINTWKETYMIYAPKRFEGGGRFSDTDCIRYGEIKSVEEIVLNQKSNYSFKEILTPITQTLFYFTEDSIRETNEEKKGAIVFLRSCDLHALKRLDDMYLKNGPEDYYYKRLRDRLKIVLIGCCKRTFDSCFCVDMETNISENYDLSIDEVNGIYRMDCKSEEFASQLKSMTVKEADVVPEHVTETTTHVHIPENLDNRINGSSMWREYDSRCIKCGRCNFVCPTCTCFTMQDFFYSENGKVGERRRVWASCMVDGYTDVAGGGSYRQKNGDRMRLKVLHKVFDYKERNGYHMCVGCGRCDDICPEYISFSNCINKLEGGMQEVTKNE